MIPLINKAKMIPKKKKNPHIIFAISTGKYSVIIFINPYVIRNVSPTSVK